MMITDRAGHQAVTEFFLVVDLPLAHGMEKRIVPNVIQRSTARVDLSDVHGRVGHKYAWTDGAVPINVEVPAAPVPTCRQAPIAGCAAVPEVGQEKVVSSHDLPGALPHPDALLRRGHQVERKRAANRHILEEPTE